MTFRSSLSFSYFQAVDSLDSKRKEGRRERESRNKCDGIITSPSNCSINAERERKRESWRCGDEHRIRHCVANCIRLNFLFYFRFVLQILHVEWINQATISKHRSPEWITMNFLHVQALFNISWYPSATIPHNPHPHTHTHVSIFIVVAVADRQQQQQRCRRWRRRLCCCFLSVFCTDSRRVSICVSSPLGSEEVCGACQQIQWAVKGMDG